jgi:hypothetical protein
MGRSPLSVKQLVEILGFPGNDGLNAVIHRPVGGEESGYDGFVLTYSVDPTGRLYVVADRIGGFDEYDI